jgi:putative transposase
LTKRSVSRGRRRPADRRGEFARARHGQADAEPNVDDGTVRAEPDSGELRRRQGAGGCARLPAQRGLAPGRGLDKRYWLNGLYAQRFNRRHGRVGHLFQARYRSILIEKPTRLLAVCRYVVLNPVRAGICRDPSEWPWSSYRQTAGLPSAVTLVEAEALLGRLGVPADDARAYYRRFVADGLSAAVEPRGERLGDVPFLKQDFGLKQPPREVPRVQWLPLPPTLAELFAAGDETPVATAYRRYGYTLQQIGEHLGCHYSTVSRRLRREEAWVLQCKT